jgi:hypothetical protein
MSKEPFFKPLCRPILPITLLGVGVRDGSYLVAKKFPSSEGAF